MLLFCDVLQNVGLVTWSNGKTTACNKLDYRRLSFGKEILPSYTLAFDLSVPSVRPQMHTNKSNTFNMASFKYCTDGRNSFCLLGTAPHNSKQSNFITAVICWYSTNKTQAVAQQNAPILSQFSCFVPSTLIHIPHSGRQSKRHHQHTLLPAYRHLMTRHNTSCLLYVGQIPFSTPLQSHTHTHTLDCLSGTHFCTFICTNVQMYLKHNTIIQHPVAIHVLGRVFKDPVTIWTWIGYKWLRIDNDCL